MRKLKLQAQTSIDGYVGGPNGELDFMTWNWSDDIKKYVNDLHETIDTILLGRKMTDGFVGHWAGVLNNPEDPSYAFAKVMIDTPKVVFTKTLEKSEWINTTLAKGDLTEEVNKLKQQDGKDLIVYGGASFDAALIKAGLIDELHLFVNPSSVGKGLPIFTEKATYKLADAKAFECGIVVLVYKPA